MKIIGVGDNVVDCYLDQRLYYPGGNALNVAVNCKRNGVESAAYLGVFGDDEAAEHIKRCLILEGVSYQYSRKVYARSGHPAVNLTPDGDRVFCGGPRDTAQHILRIRLTQQDIDYIRSFDCCHTSCFSGIEPELSVLATCCDVSFDFSTRTEKEYIDVVSRHIRFAFFSGSSLTNDEITSIIDLCHANGTEIVGMTLGEKGALFSHRGEQFYQPIKSVGKVVDTMGAGDSFIAGFLTRFYDINDMKAALDYAADRAAVTCTFYGAFGYPHPLDDL